VATVKGDKILRSNWKSFSTSAKTFLAKAEASGKAADAQTFFDLAERASKHSLEIWIELAANSALLWVQSGGGLYPDYLDFCARNGLEVLSEADFHAVLVGIR